jgi:hypothetical protein
METPGSAEKGRGLGFVLMVTFIITVALVLIKIYIFPDSQLN